jgi:lauroyl/myristoyl acyltransferase
MHSDLNIQRWSTESRPPMSRECPVTKVITISDIINSITILFCLPISWLMPESSWWPLARGISFVHIALRGTRTEALVEADIQGQLALSPSVLEREFLSGVYLELFQTLRHHRFGGWHPSVRLLGSETIEEARKRGKGVILWTTYSTFGGFMVKKALAECGSPLVTLRSFSHPFSASLFGRRYLNPIRTKMEDRQTQRVITLHKGGDIVALRALMECLKTNQVVEIAANSEGQNPAEIPFMGGQIRLALGAPTLSRLCSASIIPVFTRLTGDGRFEVVVGQPLECSDTTADGTPEEQLARGYVEFLERSLRSCPMVWRGWFSKSLWSPNGSN